MVDLNTVVTCSCLPFSKKLVESNFTRLCAPFPFLKVSAGFIFNIFCGEGSSLSGLEQIGYWRKKERVVGGSGFGLDDMADYRTGRAVTNFNLCQEFICLKNPILPVVESWCRSRSKGISRDPTMLEWQCTKPALALRCLSHSKSLSLQWL